VEVGPQSDCFVAQHVIHDFANGTANVGSPSDTVKEGNLAITYDCFDVGHAPSPPSGEYVQCVSESDAKDWFEFVKA
jgi:hypothetical protein